MKDTDNSAASYEPDFELSHRNVIREDNWPTYESKGFRALSITTDADDTIGHVRLAQEEFGIGNVYTGEAYDRESGRPLQHKPGLGIYISSEGVAYRDERSAQEQGNSRSASQPDKS
jgi:hypothetical protein